MHPVDAMQSVNVFMIEDDKFYCDFVKRVLAGRRQPYFEVRKASGISEARRYFKQEKPDVVLLDLNLPDSRGLDSLARAREIADGCPIIILTSTDNAQQGFDSISMGAQDYLVKQHIGEESLVRSIRYAIQRHRSEEQTLRLAAIQDFIATLAHDLKVPLIGADNLLTSMLAGHLGGLNSEQTDALNVMKTSTNQQLHLVKRLLEIYRYEVCSSLNPEFLLVKQLIEQTTSAFACERELTIDIQLENLTGSESIHGDAGALNNLIYNLLDNAIKFNQSTEAVQVRAEILDGKVSLQVTNAKGEMSAEVQDSLFQKFWHGVPGKTYVAKTGLGLYLCHRIVQLHRGRISCESSAEHGTTITVNLPLHQA